MNMLATPSISDPLIFVMVALLVPKIYVFPLASPVGLGVIEAPGASVVLGVRKGEVVFPMV
jgi:hypothetical protein